MNTISLLSPRKDIAFDVFPFHLLRRDPWSRPRSEDPSGALTRDPFCATPRLQINHNPPFAGDISSDDTLSQYELAYKTDKNGSRKRLNK